MKDGLLVTTGRVEPGTHMTSIAVALSRSLLAGFLASVAMIVAFSLAFVLALALAKLPIPVLSDWSRALTSNALIDMAKPNLYTALGVYFLGGLMWAMLYGLVAEGRLRGQSWERGVEFAIIPWLFSLAVFLPLVGSGFIGLSLGAGPLPIVGNAILHVVYGVVLGTVYGPAGDSVPDDPRHAAAGDDILNGPNSEIGAARGLLLGLGGGVAVGVLAVALLSETQVLHLNPLSLVVPVALIGAAFGGLIGSLTQPGGGYQR
jgi:hypothetical protein